VLLCRCSHYRPTQAAEFDKELASKAARHRLTRTNTRSILHHLLSDKHMRAYLLQMAAEDGGVGGEPAVTGLDGAAFNLDDFAGLRPKTRAFRRQLHARVFGSLLTQAQNFSRANVDANHGRDLPLVL
jgi:hypothetical protein